MTSITSRELNYMVFRYLQESGFLHSAFNFGYEAGIDKETSIDANSVPPGAIITFVQKGIQYLEMEANMKIDAADEAEAEDFLFMKPFDLLTMNANELKRILEEKRKLKVAKEIENLSKGKEIEDTDRVVKDKQKEKKHDNVKCKLKETATFGGPEPMNTPTSSTPRPRGRPRGVRSKDVLVLEGHSAEVFDCAWSPAGLVLASGSGDSTARIWSIADRSNSTSLINRVASMRVLKHYEDKPNPEIDGISTLDWNVDGRLLVTGSHDGLARKWDANGELKGVFIKHMGPVYSVKWNKKNDYVLTGGYDRSAIVWDANTNELKQQFAFHSGPIMDVDWRTNRTFASCSTDTMIYVCKLGKNQPAKVFSGHKDEVNCVKWDPSCLLLASCSDDSTAKIWSMEQDMPIHDFKGHAKAIYTVKWSPTGPTTANPNKRLLLASASFDSTVKLWDVETGGIYHSLNSHRNAVYCVSFSPNGEYLASGSGDKLMNIWSVKDGKIVKTFFGNGSISQVSWNKDGSKIAYSTSKNSVCVSDFRM